MTSMTSNYVTDSAVVNPDDTMTLNSETLCEKNLSATQSGLAIKEEGDNIRPDEMKVLDENGIDKSHPENTVKKSRGRPRKIPKKSPEGKKDDEMKVENGVDKAHAKNTVKRSRGRPRKSFNESPEGKSNPKSGVAARTLRSRSQEKHKMSNNLPDHSARASASASASASGENGRKKKRKRRIAVSDEFSRTKTHLRYLFHRMAYEQNFIDVYAGEGWKGQSAEKLRPVKELQRAKSEIFRCKLRVRNLFQRIDSSLSEGKLPQSLFDSEGEIDSEDIFCSKCGSKDVTLDNDIVLCDGACERAFHQFCLQPPLLKEDIPPGDEGWLCPGCDCKDDCLDMLNDSQGINLSILDSWEKVYSEEAAAAAAGKTLDNSLELQSDDSEDDDYRPADLEAEEKDHGEESSSDESDFYSASEGSGVAPANQQNLQLSSDDSEDDDFDPDAAGVEEEIKQESSSSDFTSSSEDLNALVEDNEANGSPHENSTMPNEFIFELDEVGRGKRPSLNDEPSSPSETATDQGKCALISARREVERLDYKKLYDEQYGNVSTDPSDEEYFDAADAPKRRRKGCIDSGKTAERRARKKLNTGATNDSPIKLNNVPSEPGASGSGVKASAAKRLGEATTQRLLESFKENQFPEQATREKLAEELGLTVLQVYNWFRNSRWSFRHSPNFASKKLAQIPSKDIQTPPHQPEQRDTQNDTNVSVDNTEIPMQALQKVEKRGRPRKSASSAKTSNGGASHEILSKEGTHASHDIPSNERDTLIGDPVDVSKSQRTEDKEKT